MQLIRNYYLEAFGLAIVWVLLSRFAGTDIHISSFADLISVFVLIVFIQFLYQSSNPEGYKPYLLLSYGALLVSAIGLVLNGPAWFLLGISGYIFALSMVFLFRSILATSSRD